MNMDKAVKIIMMTLIGIAAAMAGVVAMTCLLNHTPLSVAVTDPKNWITAIAVSIIIDVVTIGKNSR